MLPGLPFWGALMMATRPSERTEEQKARDRIIREKFAHKPSWEELVASGEISEHATTLGAYIAFRKAMAGLKRERERQGLTLDDVADRAGMDPSTISTLEDGKDADPTISTVARYAAALGKMPTWEFVPYE